MRDSIESFPLVEEDSIRKSLILVQIHVFPYFQVLFFLHILIESFTLVDDESIENGYVSTLATKSWKSETSKISYEKTYRNFQTHVGP